MEVDENMDVNAENTNARITNRKIHLTKVLNQVITIDENEETDENVAATVLGILRDVNKYEMENAFSTRVSRTDETILDAMIVRRSGRIILKCVDHLDLNSCEYNSNQFAEHIINQCSDDGNDYNEIDIMKLSEFAGKIICKVPRFATLFGTFAEARAPAKKKAARLKKVAHEVEKKKLIKVQNQEKEEEGIDEIIDFFTRVLNTEYKNNDKNAVGYYEYIADSEEYQQFVENAFYAAFLLRDGKAKLFLDDNGTPRLAPIKKRQLKELREKGGQNTEHVITLDYAMWQSLKGEGLLQKHRKLELSKK